MAGRTYSQKFDLKTAQRLLSDQQSLDDDDRSYLKSLLANRDKQSATGSVSVSLAYAANSRAGKMGYGRLYGNKYSLEHCPRKLRGTLCATHYHDIDIENCHPTILLQKAAKDGWGPLPETDNYVANRDEILSNLQQELACSRQEAKQKVLSVFNGANPPKSLIPLSQEIRAIAKKVMAQPAYKELVSSCFNKDNPLGSFLALLVQTEETSIVMRLQDIIQAQGWTVGVYMYDGLMVEHRQGKDSLPLEEWADALHKATGYRVKLVEKPMETLSPKQSVAAYAAVKKAFESQCGFSSETEKFFEYENGILRHINITTAPIIFGKWTVDGDPFLPLWLKDPTRRITKFFTQDPKQATADVAFYLPLVAHWTTLPVPSPTKAQEAINLFQKLIDGLIPNGQERAIFYEWMAQLVQQPLTNSYTSMVLFGTQGCGKSTVGLLLSAILGSTLAITITDNNLFWDKHFSAHEGKLLCCLEEANGFENRKHADSFKARITSDTVLINPKGVKPYTTKNNTRYLITTNNGNAVPVDAEQRRFLIITCGNSFVGDMDFWKTMRAILFSDDGIAAVGAWLNQQPFGEWPRKLPQTEAMIEEIEHNISSEELWITAGRNDSTDWYFPGGWKSPQDWFSNYTSWCVSSGHNAHHFQTFARQLSELARRPGFIQKVRKENGVFYKLR